MPEIYMDHPKHGATCVYEAADVRRLEGYGWRLRLQNQVPAQEEEPSIAAAEEAVFNSGKPPEAPKKNKGGRPKKK